MPPVQSPTSSHPPNNKTPTVGLFIIVSAIVIGFPMFIVIALVAKRCLVRRTKDEQRRAQLQLKGFKLQPVQQTPHSIFKHSGGSQPSDAFPRRRFTKQDSPSTTVQTSDRAKSRLSRPLSIPIRKSVLQFQSHSTPKSTPRIHEELQYPDYLSAVSACSLPSTYTARSSPESPISPISSIIPLNSINAKPRITVPENAHRANQNISRWSRHSARRRDSRWTQRLTKPFTPLVDLDFGRNLFMAVQNPDTDCESTMNIQHFDAEKGSISSTQVKKGQVSTGVPVRKEGCEIATAGITVITEPGKKSPVSQQKDASWQHARLETVDGVLAPREWL